MNVLITNDDGIDAPGLAALEFVARQYGSPVVCAPASEQSGSGHRVTVDRPLRVVKRSESRFTVDGTPADCVRIAFTSLSIEFGMVLSGINSGGNLGVDVFMSGTAAAAREASYYAVPSFAISQYRCRKYVEDWNRSQVLTQRAIDHVIDKPGHESGFWNINLPSIPSVSVAGNEVPLRICRVDRNPHKVSFRRDGDGYQYEGSYQDRPKDPASDVDLCFNGAVTISRVS